MRRFRKPLTYLKHDDSDDGGDILLAIARRNRILQQATPIT